MVVKSGNSDAKVQYKGLSDKLCDDFGFKIDANRKVENSENVHCIHCSAPSASYLSYISYIFQPPPINPINMTKSPINSYILCDLLFFLQNAICDLVHFGGNF
jgi:hypothetical protein